MTSQTAKKKRTNMLQTQRKDSITVVKNLVLAIKNHHMKDVDIVKT